MVDGEAQRLLHLIVAFDDDIACGPTLLPRGLVRCQHPAPAKRAAARQRIGGNQGRVVRQPVRPRYRDETVEFEHLSGNRTPAPDPAQREGPLRDERTAIGSQRDAARHRDGFAGTLRAPGTEIAVQLQRLHAHAGHGEAGLQRHVDSVAVERKPQELQRHRAVRQ
jgi:hypothetical protein